jgi:hypothetical protein
LLHAGVGSESGGAPSADEVADKMRDTVVSEGLLLRCGGWWWGDVVLRLCWWWCADVCGEGKPFSVETPTGSVGPAVGAGTGQFHAIDQERVISAYQLCAWSFPTCPFPAQTVPCPSLSPSSSPQPSKPPQIHDTPPKGATVLFSQKEKENEAKYDDSAATPHTGTAAGGVGGEAAGGGSGVTGYGGEAGSVPVGGGATAAVAEAPAGDDDDAHLKATGARGDKVL